LRTFAAVGYKGCPMSEGHEAGAESAFQQAVQRMLTELDPEPGREGLRDTPRRVEKAFRFYTDGYRRDPKKEIGDALFEAETDEMVLVKDIEIYSLCEHHLAPFFGKAHVAYIPSDKIVGLSKLARVVDIYARRLQVQERLTMQVAHAINEVMKPRGVAVVIEASHLCMMMRGVEKQNSRTVTSCLLGLFRKDERTRTEFLKLVRG
jgi:GTP cyclohydrolase I